MLTTKGFFCYMSTLLCQKLMFAGKWRGDLAVTLAALEFLSGMAQLNIKFVGMFFPCDLFVYITIKI